MEEFCLDAEDSRGAYVERARLLTAPTHAVVRDGRSHERGRMGWFASVTGEQPEESSTWSVTARRSW